MKSSRDKEFIDWIDPILEANFEKENFGVRELAGKLLISRSQLHRKFKAALGITASAYLNEFRLKKAMALLRQGKFSASEVAFAVGFNSPSYFSTSFKKHYSYSPTHVLKTINEDALILKYNSTKKKPAHAKLTVPKLSNNRRHYWFFPIFIIVAGLVLSYFFVFSKDLKETQLDTSKEKSIAVLPFRNYSNDPDMESFCNGMADEIISKLAQIGVFDRVISRTSSFKFKETNLRIKEIGSELNVRYVLESSIQRTVDKIRVTVQLIDVETDGHVWTDNFTEDWNSIDIFDIQDQITLSVVNAMQTELTLNEARRVHHRLTPSKAAYKLYLQAKYQSYSADEGSMENAKVLLIEAISLDPSFAEAYSLLGYIWMCSGFAEGFSKQEVAWNKAKDFLLKAKELDPTLIKNEFSLLQGQFYYDWNFKRLEQFYHNDFDKYTYDRESCGLIDYALKTGRFGKGLEVINKSIEVDPLDPALSSFKARALYFIGNKEEAVEILQHLDPLNMNDWFYLREATYTYYLMKEYDYSENLLNILIDRFEDRSPFTVWLQLFYAHHDNDSAKVDSLLKVLMQAYENEVSGSPSWFIALYYLEIENDIEKALKWLEISYQHKEVELTWMLYEPALNPIRNNPQYKALLHKIGFDELKLE